MGRKIFLFIVLILALAAAFPAVLAVLILIQSGWCGEVLAGIPFGLLSLWLFSIYIEEKDKGTPPPHYSRNERIEKIRYIKIRFTDNKIGSSIESRYEDTPRFQKYSGTYSFFVDSGFMVGDRYSKEIVGIYDADMNPLRVNDFSYSFSGVKEGDCGFVEIC